MNLKQLTLKDTAELYALIEVSRQDLTMLEWSKGATFESTARFIVGQNDNNKHYKIVYCEEIVGLLGLWDLGDFYSIGYWIGTPWRGFGIVKTALTYFLPPDLLNPRKELRARVKKSNEKSIKILLHSGFKKINDFQEKGEDWVMFSWVSPYLPR